MVKGPKGQDVGKTNSLPKEITRINSGSEVERMRVRQKLKSLRNSGKRPAARNMVPPDQHSKNKQEDQCSRGEAQL